MLVALYESEATRLVQWAGWFVRDRGAAEDLVQEAFLKFAVSAPHIEDRGCAAAYLRSIVRNLARDHHRRRVVSLRHQWPREAAERSAEDHASDRELVLEMLRALRGLPGRQRDCLALRYYLDLPPQVIADTLGLSVNSVKTHLRRGLRRLAADLAEPP